MTFRTMTCVLAVFGLASVDCSDDSAAATGAEAEPAELSGITAAHNSLRAEVGVPPLKWNAQLASLAAGFIADCQFQHSSGAERSNVAGFSYVGENLFMASFKPTGQLVSESWAEEKSNYDPSTGACSGVCGHYTQQVWRTTTDLGCATKDCGTSFIVSCEYGPGGNTGGKAY